METWSEENQEGRWRRYGRQELLDRDKASLDLFWLKGQEPHRLDNLDPDVLAEEIIKKLEAWLADCQGRPLEEGAPPAGGPDPGEGDPGGA